MSDNITDVIQQLAVPRYAPRIKPTPIPGAAWNEAPLFCLKLNDEWVSHVLGVLAALDQADAWEGTDDEIYAARQQVNEIMAAFMEECDPMSNCCPEPLTRITDDGVMEVSYDGGMTWTPATTEDPRNTAPQLPPLSGDDGDDKRCRAANNVVRQLKELQIEWAHHLGAGLSVLQLALTFAAGAVAIFLTGGGLAPILVPALLTLAAGVVGTGEEAYNDLFTTDVWDFVLCQVYCQSEPDGTFTSTGFNNILANCDSHFSGTLALAFSAALTAWQLPGLNQAAKIPSTDNLDCSACDCETSHVWQWDLVGTPVRLFPDEDGLFTATTGAALSGHYNIYIMFAAALDDTNWTPCNTLTVMSSDSNEPSFHPQNRCRDGVDDPLSACNAGYLYRGTVPWTLTFTVGDGCT